MQLSKALCSGKNQMIKEFETDNFLVRPIEKSDVVFAFENWTQQYEIAKFMTWKPHISIEETKQFIDSCIKGWQNNDYTWIIETKLQRKIVGSFAARRNEHKVDIGYLLLKEHWGKGYMPEVIRAFIILAFKIEGVSRVWAVCDIENQASKRALEKAGMESEGILKSWLVHPNMGRTPRDCHCLSIVKYEA